MAMPIQLRSPVRPLRANVSDDTDCDDTDAGVNPGATEVCNGIDDDCDGLVDESGGNATWYADTDGDGYGDANSTTVACTAPPGYVSDDTDCDDTDAGVNPGATEVCNGIDDDCDGLVDESGGNATWYADTDGDGYGDAGSTVTACTQPPGYVADNTDCDDTNGSINPSADEVCDGVDNDCDGTVDQNPYERPDVVCRCGWRHLRRLGQLSYCLYDACWLCK